MPEMVTVLILRAVSFAGRALCTTLCFEIFILVHLFLLLHEKFQQFDWNGRAVVFQLNLKYLRVKITNLL